MEAVLDDIPVMYVVSPNGPMGSPKAFNKLEDAVNWQLKGRCFYGTMFNSEYRANLAIIDEEEPEKLNLSTWTIPGGKYVRNKIENWEKNIEAIKPKFEEMIANSDYDDSRPIIEFYRSQTELFLFVPVK